jgi:hypothetical protein
MWVQCVADYNSTEKFMNDDYENTIHAFPTEIYDGMTLRDYFAAKAMQAYMGEPDMKWSDSVYENAAKAAYLAADAMMEARK